MKSKKVSMFKFVNSGMVIFCICSMCMNYVGVNVRGTNAATSSINGNNFEYTVRDNSLEFKKNGDLIGSLPMDRKMYIRNDNLLFQSNAAVVSGKVVAAIAAGGMAAAGPAAIAALQQILGGAFATAVASITIPGEAAVAATLGGAGEAAAAAAAADAAIAAGGVGALMSAFVVPVLVAAGAGAVVM